MAQMNLVRFFQHYFKRHNLEMKIIVSWDFNTDCNIFCQSTTVTQVAESMKRPKNLSYNKCMTL
jgi:hypothetical protein